MSANSTSVTSKSARLIATVGATVGLAALLTGCITAAEPTAQEMAMVDSAASPLLPATAADRALADKQDLLTQAKFWAAEYEKNPNEYEAALKYARVLRAIGSAPRSAEVAQQALTLKQGDVEMSMIYAQSSLDIGKADDAAFVLARAESAGQNDWRLLSIIGVTMDTLNEHTQAQDYYRRALALSPDNPKILSNLGLSYILQGKPALAEQTLRQAAALPGADSRITQNLIMALGVQGKFEDVDQIAATDLPPALVAANREYFRNLLNPSRSWESLRGTQN
jgi:Flp pilus assembly protein TadD